MTRRQLTWLLAGLLAIPVLLLSAFGFLAGTESGTRWLFKTAQPYLPAPLSIRDPRGALLSGVSIGRLAWRDDSVDVEVTGLRVDLELLPLLNRQIHIVDFEATGIAVEIEPRETPDSPSPGLPDIQLPVSIRVDRADISDIWIAPLGDDREIQHLAFSGSFDDSWLELNDLELDSDWLELALDGRLRLARRYPAQIAATWRYVHSEELSLAGHLDLDGELRGYQLVHDLEQPFEISSRGTVALDDGLSIDIVNTWRSLSWPVAERALVATDGRLTVQGSLDDLGIVLDTVAQLDGYPEAELALRGRTDLQSLDAEMLRLSAEAGNLIVAGNFGWTGTPSFDLRLDASDLDASLVSERVAGRVGMAATARGTLPDGGPVADVDILSLSGSLNGHPLSGDARLAIAGSALDIEESRLVLGTSRLNVAGSVAERLDLSGTLEMDDLRQLDGRLAGALTSRFDVAGDRGAPTVAATLDARQPGWNAITAERLTVEGRLAADKSIETSIKAAGLTTGAVTFDEAVATLDGSQSLHRFRLEASSVEGRSLLVGSGRLADGGWSGRVETLDVDTRVLADWSLDTPVEIEASGTAASVSSFCLNSGVNDGSICSGFSWRSAEGGDLDLSVRSFPLAALPFTLPAGATLSGHIEADVRGSFDEAGIRGTGDARLVDAAVDATYEDEPYRLALTLARLTADIDNSRLTSLLAVEADAGAGSLDARLTVDDLRNGDSPIDGNGNLSIPDASIFAAFAPDVSDPGGRVEGNVAVTGSVSAPRFSGEILLEDGAFGVRPAGIRITDLNVALRQREIGQLELVGSARSGEGSLAIDGRTSMADETGLRTEIRFKGDNFTLLELPDWQLAASPDIRLVLDESAAVITGSLDVPRADITVKSIPETATRPSGDVVVHGDRLTEEERRRRIDVDVMATLGEDVRLSGFGLTTNVSGAVRVRGGSNRPYTGAGSLNLIEGRYKAYGQNLEIERGELIFNGPLDTPQLDLEAVRRVEQYDVLAGIRVTGTPRRLRSSLYSEPAMSDAEALSYLLSGRPLSAPGDSGDSDFLNKAAFALGLSQAGSIASQIRGDLGLDTLKVEGGTESGRIVAGKRIGDRLLVEYGYGLIDKLGTLLLRYELTNNLILESRTGTTSELDLVYSVKKK